VGHISACKNELRNKENNLVGTHRLRHLGPDGGIILKCTEDEDRV
jgi:hypothetical protein